MKILLVEDTPPVLRALERQLELAGYDFVSARNGQEAVEVLGREYHEIGLIISDWMMPKMDGLELLTTIRGRSEYQDIPFLMLTGRDASEDAVTSLKAGANDYIRKPYQPEEMLARVANMFKASVFQKQLHEQASLDGLTGLNNHKTFQHTLRTEISRAKRYDGFLSLVMLDIDHFKKFNDQFGHQTGDFILQGLAGVLRENIRTVDIPCRYGGEEFCLILPSTDLEGAVIVAERIRAALEGKHFEHEGTIHLITCSFGAALFDIERDTPESLIKKADNALYQAKREGRNRVCAA